MKQISTYLTDEQDAALRAAARTSGQNLAAFIRTAIADRVEAFDYSWPDEEIRRGAWLSDNQNKPIITVNEDLEVIVGRRIIRAGGASIMPAHNWRDLQNAALNEVFEQGGSRTKPGEYACSDELAQRADW